MLHIELHLQKNLIKSIATKIKNTLQTKPTKNIKLQKNTTKIKKKQITTKIHITKNNNKQYNKKT